jgi:hypothetical protein
MTRKPIRYGEPWGEILYALAFAAFLAMRCCANAK